MKVTLKTSLLLGRIAGIPTSIHWTFLLVIVWMVTINLLAGFQTEEFVWSLFLLISLLASVFVHELGHALTAKYFGIQAKGLILLPVGGVPKMPLETIKLFRELMILLAGPAVNLAIAGLLMFYIHPYPAYWNDPENIGVVNRGNFLFQLQVINLSLGLFNLLPVFPMDGGRMLAASIGVKLNKAKAIKIVNITSIIIALGFIISGFIVMNVLSIMTGFFILFTLQTEAYY